MIPTSLARRKFLADGSLLLLAAGCASSNSTCDLLAADAPRPLVRAGIVTDLHYADKPAAGSRHYRETLDKLAEAATYYEKEKPDLMIELGDLVDAATSIDEEKKWLARIYRELAALPGEKHCVLGNHCVTTLTKAEFLEGVEQKQPHYAFDRGGIHFVVLDACYRADGEAYGRDNFKWNDANIPASEVAWLKEDLAEAKGPVVVLAHQRLDVKNDHGVKNAEEVRAVLEGSGKVLAVFQGHSHKNDLREIGGIHYATMVAMVEGSGATSNGYSLVEVYGDGAIRITGSRQQKSYDWPAKSSGQ